MGNFNDYGYPEYWHRTIKENILELEKYQECKKSKIHDKQHIPGYSSVRKKVDNVDIFEGKTNYHGQHFTYVRKFGEEGD